MRYVRQGLHKGALPVPVVSKQWVIVARWSPACRLHLTGLCTSSPRGKEQCLTDEELIDVIRQFEELRIEMARLLRENDQLKQQSQWYDDTHTCRVLRTLTSGCVWGSWPDRVASSWTKRASSQFNCHQQHLGWGRVAIDRWAPQASAVPIRIHERQEAVGLASNLKTRHRAFTVAMSCVILLHDFEFALRHLSSFFVFVRVRVGGKSHSP